MLSLLSIRAASRVIKLAGGASFAFPFGIAQAQRRQTRKNNNGAGMNRLAASVHRTRPQQIAGRCPADAPMTPAGLLDYVAAGESQTRSAQWTRHSDRNAAIPVPALATIDRRGLQPSNEELGAVSASMPPHPVIQPPYRDFQAGNPKSTDQFSKPQPPQPHNHRFSLPVIAGSCGAALTACLKRSSGKMRVISASCPMTMVMVSYQNDSHLTLYQVLKQP